MCVYYIVYTDNVYDVSRHIQHCTPVNFPASMWGLPSLPFRVYTKCSWHVLCVKTQGKIMFRQNNIVVLDILCISAREHCNLISRKYNGRSYTLCLLCCKSFLTHFIIRRIKSPVAGSITLACNKRLIYTSDLSCIKR